VPEADEFALDPAAAPARIFLGRPQHQRFHRARGWRPAGLAPALAPVPLENMIRAVSCADVVGSGEVQVLVDQAPEYGLSSNSVVLQVGDRGRGA
jgi:hypothetical protein